MAHSVTDDPVMLAGLIGRAIGASRSPAIHRTEAAALGLRLSYRLIDFDRLGWADDDLLRAVDMLRGIDAVGCNVTFPFKQRIMDHCDTLGREAEMLGAVNTLVFHDGAIHGENTDWLGFSWLIEREFGNVSGARVAQVGAGGAGSATALALARLGASELMLFDPEAARADALIARLTPHCPGTRFVRSASVAEAVAGADGIVNATPVGMVKMPGTPIDPTLMQSSQWLADIIYFPLETQLLRDARARGLRVANGVSMVAGQAAAALAMFTGAAPDRERMLSRLLLDIASEAQQRKDGA